MTKMDQSIKWLMTLVVLGVAGVAATISYSHGVEVATHYGGQTGWTAALLPATVDSLILSGNLTGLFCARFQLPKPKLAVFALGLGVAATLTMKVAQGLTHGPVAAAIAGWPAIVFLVSSELLLWMVHAAKALSKVEVVQVPKEHPKHGNKVVEAAELLANEKGISAAEIGRRLKVSYPLALNITREARTLLARPA